MANKKDCEICKQMMAKKHRFDKFYKIGFWVVSVLLAIISTLYFATGDMFRYSETQNINNAEINIDNGGSNNNNKINIGS